MHVTTQANLSPTRTQHHFRQTRHIRHRPVSQFLSRNGDLNGDEMDHSPIVTPEHRDHMEQHPKRRSGFAVIQEAHLNGPLLANRLADLHDRSPVGLGTLERPPVSPDDLFPRVPGHLEEPGAGENDRVARDERVGDRETVRKLV